MPKIKKELIQYKGEDKEIIRKKIIETINKEYEKDPTTTFLDLFGEGESYNQVRKETKARILSIDNNPTIAKKMRTLPDTRFISIYDLCIEARESFNVMYLDYCGILKEGGDIEKDLMVLPNIMKDKGVLFLTLSMRDIDYDKGTDRHMMERAIVSTIAHDFMINKVKIERMYTAKYKSFATIKGKRKKGNYTPMKVYKFLWEKVIERIDTIPFKFDDTLILPTDITD